MKKKVYMALLIFLTTILGQVKAAQVVKGNPVSSNEALVCFVDFRIGLVVGKSEADIGNIKYCRYAIDRKKFLSLMTSMPTSTFYMSGNVRAKISWSDKDVYFVDYNGIVRHGEAKVQINKIDFTKALRKIGGEATQQVIHH